jgi:hypothetical protein
MKLHPPRRAHARPAQPGGAVLARADPAPTSALVPGTTQRFGPMAAPAAPTPKVERAAAQPAGEPPAGCRAGPAVPTRRVERVEAPAVPMRSVERVEAPAVPMRSVEVSAGPAVSMRRVGAGPAGSTIRVERGTVPDVATSGEERGTVPVVATRRVEQGAGRAVPTWELASTQRRVVAEGRLARRAGAGPWRRVAQPDRGVRGGRPMTGRPGVPARRMGKGCRVAGRHGTRRRPDRAGVGHAIGRLTRGQPPLDPGTATAELEAPRGRDPAGPEPLGPVTGDPDRRAAGWPPPHRPGGRAAEVGRGPRRQPGQRPAGRRSPKGRPLMGERRSGSTRR